MSARDELIRLVDRLPESQLHAALQYLQFLVVQGETGATSNVLSTFHEEVVQLDDLESTDFALEELETRSSSKDWGYGGVEDTLMTSYNVTYRGQRFRMSLHRVLNGREAYGTLRQRILVARSTTEVMVEFTGADDFQTSRRLFSVLKLEDGTQVKSLKDVPSLYQEFQVEPLATLVHDGVNRRGLAVVVTEGDAESMVKYGALRWLERNGLL